MSTNIIDFESNRRKFSAPAGPPPPETVACNGCDPALYAQYVATITSASDLNPTFAFIDADTEALGAGVHTLTENGSCIWRKSFVNPNGDGLDWNIDLSYDGINSEWRIEMYDELFNDYWIMVWTEHPDGLYCTGPAVGAGGPYDDTPTPYAYVANPPGA